jgi:hypothetical protein
VGKFCSFWDCLFILKIHIALDLFQNMAANAFAKGLSSAAPFVAIVLLLPAPIAAFNSWLKKKRRKGK